MVTWSSLMVNKVSRCYRCSRLSTHSPFTCDFSVKFSVAVMNRKMSSVFRETPLASIQAGVCERNKAAPTDSTNPSAQPLWNQNTEKQL